MSKLKLKFALVVLLAVGSLFAASAFAVDGQIVINQSSVMAAGGFPYKITQPGSYKLSENLVVPASLNGIDITADNVTLDLNGFNISGPQQCTIEAEGVSCSGPTIGWGVFSEQRNTTVKNGSITGMASGGVSAFNALIEELRVSQNGYGIIASGIVRHCTALLNRYNGIGLAQGVLQDSVITENGAGLSANLATVTGNQITSNFGDFGMFCSYTLFGSNSFFSNKPANISAQIGTTSQNNNNCDGATC